MAPTGRVQLVQLQQISRSQVSHPQIARGVFDPVKNMATVTGLNAGSYSGRGEERGYRQQEEEETRCSVFCYAKPAVQKPCATCSCFCCALVFFILVSFWKRLCSPSWFESNRIIGKQDRTSHSSLIFCECRYLSMDARTRSGNCTTKLPDGCQVCCSKCALRRDNATARTRDGLTDRWLPSRYITPCQ